MIRYRIQRRRLERYLAEPLNVLAGLQATGLRPTRSRPQATSAAGRAVRGGSRRPNFPEPGSHLDEKVRVSCSSEAEKRPKATLYRMSVIVPFVMVVSITV